MLPICRATLHFLLRFTVASGNVGTYKIEAECSEGGEMSTLSIDVLVNRISDVFAIDHSILKRTLEDCS